MRLHTNTSAEQAITHEQRIVIDAVYPWLLEDDCRSYTTEQLRLRLGFRNRNAVYRFLANHGIDTVRLFDRTLRIPRQAIIFALLRRNEMM